MMEVNLVGILAAICPEVYPDMGPAESVNPYVVWQILGGQSVVSFDNIPANKRNSYLQVSVWTATRLESLQLIRQIEDALRATNLFQAVPSGEPISTYEPETSLYGSIQRFSVWADR